MIEAQGITRKYYIGGEEIQAVNDLCLNIDKGSSSPSSGPPAPGKTTLLHLLGLLDTPDAGHIVIDGTDISTLSPPRANPPAAGDVSASSSRSTTCCRCSTPPRTWSCRCAIRECQRDAERRRRAVEALERVGLEKRMKNRPTQLSGGEQQRVAIARALITDPVLVLADEPTGELDTANSCRIIELMRDINRETEPDRGHRHPQPHGGRLHAAHHHPAGRRRSSPTWPGRKPRCNATAGRWCRGQV